MLRLAGRHRQQDRTAHMAQRRLPPCECEVLQALVNGLSDKEIAAHLHLGTETVRTHMVNILGKLGVESRLQAPAFALRHGPVKLD
jgi:DNA-binding NarL/FixJ family response regulator